MQNNHIEYLGGELALFKNATNWKKYFSNKLHPYIKGNVLEVGAGTGINTPFLIPNANVIESWFCLEPDLNMSSQIDDNVSKLGINNIKVFSGTIEEIKDQSFDTIIYIDVIEHIQDSQKEIRLAKDRLNSNGHLIILVPAYGFLFSEFDEKIGHYRRYNKELLNYEINGNLHEVQLYYLDSLGFFASSANKLLLKKTLPTNKDIWFWDKIMIPCSKFLDRLFFRSFGKSLIGIYKK